MIHWQDFSLDAVQQKNNLLVSQVGAWANAGCLLASWWRSRALPFSPLQIKIRQGSVRPRQGLQL
jgi:hypothetical protein